MLNRNDKVFAAAYMLFEELCLKMEDVVSCTPSLEEKAWLFTTYMSDEEKARIQRRMREYLQNHRLELPGEFLDSRVEIRFLSNRTGFEITDGFIAMTYRFETRGKNSILIVEKAPREE